MNSDADKLEKLSKNEDIKANSDYLLGTILEGLEDQSTGAISSDDSQLTKFHGTYLQDDRDLRAERVKKKLEKAFSFMVRIRVPGGLCSRAQWLEIDRLSNQFADGTIKLTTRQAFQLHGVLKGNLKQTIKEINDTLLDTLAACGDVNRNVMCSPNPFESRLHAETQDLAESISSHLTPQTSSYAEIWLDGERQSVGPEGEIEPIYGKTYLPRKFKIAVALPPRNDVDVFSNDLGFVAIVEEQEIVGYNILAGGGLGMTHGKPGTYPRIADVIGFCKPGEVLQVAEEAVKVQRDYGDRSDRRHARLKYTIEDRGVGWFKAELEKRLGWSLESARDFSFDLTTDRYGWTEDHDGKWAYCLFVEGGRLRDSEEASAKSAISELADSHEGDFRLTPNQNLIIGRVEEPNKAVVEETLLKHGVPLSSELSGLRLNSIACTALPTCGLALAEAERFLPSLVDDVDQVLQQAGLRDESIAIRATGCPNGCGRPYLGEIGLVGKAPGKYNLYLGAAINGTRLNKLYRQALTHEEILAALRPLIRDFANERAGAESFGDFCIRKGLVKASDHGPGFHD